MAVCYVVVHQVKQNIQELNVIYIFMFLFCLSFICMVS